MAKNPMFGNNVSPNSATTPNNPVNDSYKSYKRGYNTFDLRRDFYNTERFADINVIDVLEGVEKDVLPFGNRHEIRSYTMNSPVMFDLQKKKSYFMVDNKAILPLNWEKVYKLPNKGDDVDSSVNCFARDMLYNLGRFLSNIVPTDNGGYQIGLQTPSSGSLYTSSVYNYVWRVILLLESIFSDGSLLSSMNCHLSSMLSVYINNVGSSVAGAIDNTLTFDDWLEETFSYFKSKLSVKFPSLSSNFFSADSSSSGRRVVPLRTLLDMMRTYPDFVVDFTVGNTDDRLDFLFRRLSLLKPRYDNDSNYSADEYGLNLSRLIAYQLVCAQFYTKDSVDNVYNSELYIQNAKSTYLKFYNYVQSYQVMPTFTYNGIICEYDVFSGYCIDRAFYFLDDFLLSGSGNSYYFNYDFFKEVYNYLHMIFFYRKSIRYGDYFVGAKTRPLAVGDVDIEVNTQDGTVSAVDITRNLLLQRFKHAVERVPNTWKDYLSGVTDGVAAPKDTEPRFLASSTHSVKGFEVENTTSENQGNIVTVLKSSNSNYVYEVKVGSPCIIIGVSTYQVAGVYSRTVDRFFKHAVREDMFNKFMQNIGDQEITMNERSASYSPTRCYGYTLRHMEYKQRYPIAAGGFIKNLPGYAFIRDNVQSGQLDLDFSDAGLHINSSFIRNRNSEMDRFYDNLSGLGLASYFHFIVKYTNYCNAKRPMEFTPTIL